jgi:hypothetical protein
MQINELKSKNENYSKRPLILTIFLVRGLLKKKGSIMALQTLGIEVYEEEKLDRMENESISFI